MTQRLLFADDSLTMHRVVEITFGQEDVTLMRAHSGAEAINVAAAQGPDVALLDVDLGDMDGYALCTQLQAARSARLPVLLLVSDQHPVDEERLKACGAVGFVKKPFDTQTLIARVREAGLAMETSPPVPPALPQVQHAPPRPAFFDTPPPVPLQAAPTPIQEEHTNPWTIGAGVPPCLPQSGADKTASPVMPQAKDLPELPTWAVDLGAAPPPAPVAAEAPKAHEPLWSEKEATTAEDLRRPEVDLALIGMARADAQQATASPPAAIHPAPAAQMPDAPSPQRHSGGAQTQVLAAALTQALAHVPALNGQASEALAQALAPVLLKTIERVLWDLLPGIAQAQLQAAAAKQKP